MFFFHFSAVLLCFALQFARYFLRYILREFSLSKFYGPMIANAESGAVRHEIQPQQVPSDDAVLGPIINKYINILLRSLLSPARCVRNPYSSIGQYSGRYTACCSSLYSRGVYRGRKVVNLSRLALPSVRGGSQFRYS